MTTERPMDLQYWHTAQQRQAQRQAAQRQQTELAWQAARQAAGGLYQQFGVSQVLLFGSLARAVPLHAHSDIDLAVYGLPEQSYLKALSYLLELDVPFDFDLVRIEEATPRLLRDIDRDGVRL